MRKLFQLRKIKKTPKKSKVTEKHQERCVINKVLIVDDDQMNRFILKQYLINYGISECSILEKTNGKEVIDLYDDSSSVFMDINIIFIDKKMPYMDGVDTIKYLTTKGYNGITVCITGYTDSNTRKQLTDAGANHILSKPIIYNNFVCLLDRIILKK